MAKAILISGEASVEDLGRRLTHLLSVGLEVEVQHGPGLVIWAGDNRFIRIILNPKLWRRFGLALTATAAASSAMVWEGAMNEVGKDIYDLLKDGAHSEPTEEQQDNLLNLVDLLRLPNLIVTFGVALDEAGLNEPSPHNGQNVLAFSGPPTIETVAALALEADGMRRQITEAFAGGAYFDPGRSNGDLSGPLSRHDDGSLKAFLLNSSGQQIVVNSRSGAKVATSEDL